MNEMYKHGTVKSGFQPYNDARHTITWDTDAWLRGPRSMVESILAKKRPRPAALGFASLTLGVIDEAPVRLHFWHPDAHIVEQLHRHDTGFFTTTLSGSMQYHLHDVTEGTDHRHVNERVFAPDTPCTPKHRTTIQSKAIETHFESGLHSVTALQPSITLCYVTDPIESVYSVQIPEHVEAKDAAWWQPRIQEAIEALPEHWAEHPPWLEPFCQAIEAA